MYYYVWPRKGTYFLGRYLRVGQVFSGMDDVVWKKAPKCIIIKLFAKDIGMKKVGSSQEHRLHFEDELHLNHLITGFPYSKNI
jgi:hypothetical protein